MMLRRHGQRRALRNMGVLRQMHDDALAADARGDAVDQGGQFVIVVHMGIEIALLLHHDFDAAGGQPDEIEAEAGIERIVQGIEPLAEQPVDHLGLVTGCPVSTAIARTAPSVRKKLASSRRAPLPCLSIAATSICGEADKVAAITPSVATGSGKRFSTM